MSYNINSQYDLLKLLAQYNASGKDWFEDADNTVNSDEGDGYLIKGEFTTFLEKNGVNITDKKTEDIITKFWNNFDKNEGVDPKKKIKGTDLYNLHALDENEQIKLDNQVQSYTVLLKFLREDVEKFLNEYDESRTRKQNMGKYLPDWKTEIESELGKIVTESTTVVTYTDLKTRFDAIAPDCYKKYKLYAQVDLMLASVKSQYPYFTNWEELESLVRTAMMDGKSAAEIQKIIDNYVKDIDPTTNYAEINEDFSDVVSGFTYIQQTEIINHLKQTLYAFINQYMDSIVNKDREVYEQAIDLFIRNVLSGNGVGAMRAGESYDDVFNRIMKLSSAGAYGDTNVYSHFTSSGALAEAMINNMDESSYLYQYISDNVGPEYASYLISDKANPKLLNFILSEIKIQMRTTANDVTGTYPPSLDCHNIDHICREVVEILNNVLEENRVKKIVVDESTGYAKLNSSRTDYLTTDSEGAHYTPEELAFFKYGLSESWSNERLAEYIRDVQADYKTSDVHTESMADAFSSYIEILSSRGYDCDGILRDIINEMLSSGSYDATQTEALKQLLNGYNEGLMFNSNLSKDNINAVIDKFLNGIASGVTGSSTTTGGGSTPPPSIPYEGTKAIEIDRSSAINNYAMTDIVWSSSDSDWSSDGAGADGEVNDACKTNASRRISSFIDEIVNTLRAESSAYDLSILDRVADATKSYFEGFVSSVYDYEYDCGFWGGGKDGDVENGFSVTGSSFSYTDVNGNLATVTNPTYLQIRRGHKSKMFNNSNINYVYPIYLLEDNTGDNQFYIAFSKGAVAEKFKEFYNYFT